MQKKVIKTGSAKTKRFSENENCLRDALVHCIFIFIFNQKYGMFPGSIFIVI